MFKKNKELDTNKHEIISDKEDISIDKDNKEDISIDKDGIGIDKDNKDMTGGESDGNPKQNYVNYKEVFYDKLPFSYKQVDIFTKLLIIALVGVMIYLVITSNVMPWIK